MGSQHRLVRLVLTYCGPSLDEMYAKIIEAMGNCDHFVIVSPVTSTEARITLPSSGGAIPLGDGRRFEIQIAYFDGWKVFDHFKTFAKSCAGPLPGSIAKIFMVTEEGRPHWFQDAVGYIEVSWTDLVTSSHAPEPELYPQFFSGVYRNTHVS